MRVANLFDVETTRDADDPVGYETPYARIGPLVGAAALGASVYVLDEGQSVCPYHYESDEEWLIVLRGEPTLRDPGGERRLAAGDAVVFKRGPEGAHTIRNDTDEPVRLLLLSSDRDSAVEVAFYTDSGKVGVFGDAVRKLLREDAEIDYFEGEEQT